MFNSFQSRPELPPSSATVTIAVILTGNVFKPFKSTDNPVPPPIVMIFALLTVLFPFLYVYPGDFDVRNIH